ncbi:MAG: DNA cytosine methyltransferase [Candidatus Peribacteraceae bacterium]|nr:DNA cytosine methyltransferase [Candidatus Peribacteraceae bacterium]
MNPTVIEICTGGGGQALGLEMAGFEMMAAVEIESKYCDTLRLNRPHWNVIQADVRNIKGKDFEGVDLFAGGVPCPPFSIAGKQLGKMDSRDMFPEALRLIGEINPKAVLLENVPGFASAKFAGYRASLMNKFKKMGYVPSWRILHSSNYGVPQLRPRFVLVALKKEYSEGFYWPEPIGTAPTVGSALFDLMAERGWKGAAAWASEANTIGPTLVGGSLKHGGPDLGPTRARHQWELLRVDGRSLADTAPEARFSINGMPRLTARMAARIQGFPDEWQFAGKKTSAYRQIGNAFPPPVALAVGKSIISALQTQKFSAVHSRLPTYAAA